MLHVDDQPGCSNHGNCKRATSQSAISNSTIVDRQESDKGNDEEKDFPAQYAKIAVQMLLVIHLWEARLVPSK